MIHGNLAIDPKCEYYSIEITSGPVSCAGCSMQFDADGPTGFEDGKAICPRCLLKRSEELGVILVLSSAAREFVASTSPEQRNLDYWATTSELTITCKTFLDDSSEPKWCLYDEWLKNRTQKREGNS